jgi:hypothetical protein
MNRLIRSHTFSDIFGTDGQLNKHSKGRGTFRAADKHISYANSDLCQPETVLHILVRIRADNLRPVSRPDGLSIISQLSFEALNVWLSCCACFIPNHNNSRSQCSLLWQTAYTHSVAIRHFEHWYRFALDRNHRRLYVNSRSGCKVRW